MSNIDLIKEYCKQKNFKVIKITPLPYRKDLYEVYGKNEHGKVTHNLYVNEEKKVIPLPE